VNTHITTTCPRCGTVVLRPEDLRLIRGPVKDEAWYCWDCSGCGHLVRKEAADGVWQALTRVGVPSWQVPAEVIERCRDRDLDDRRPVGTDDVLDAILFLRSRSFLAPLAAG